jgi:uncharacterized protein YggL (DUF469 family)
MKKRIRKKKRLGEFVEWGALLKARLNISTEERLDAFMDEFIEMIESLNCYCGGGISIERGLDMVVELGVNKKVALDKLEQVEVWLNGHECVVTVEVLGTKHGGQYDKIFDLWHEEPLELGV